MALFDRAGDFLLVCRCVILYRLRDIIAAYLWIKLRSSDDRKWPNVPFSSMDAVVRMIDKWKWTGKTGYGKEAENQNWIGYCKEVKSGRKFSVG